MSGTAPTLPSQRTRAASLSRPAPPAYGKLDGDLGAAHHGAVQAVLGILGIPAVVVLQSAGSMVAAYCMSGVAA